MSDIIDHLDGLRYVQYDLLPAGTSSEMLFGSLASRVDAVLRQGYVVGGVMTARCRISLRTGVYGAGDAEVAAVMDVLRDGWYWLFEYDTMLMALESHPEWSAKAEVFLRSLCLRVDGWYGDQDLTSEMRADILMTLGYAVAFSHQSRLPAP